MKIRVLPCPRHSGYATMAVVSALAFMLVAMLAFTIRGNISTTSAQARSQVKQDYSQKEDAILSALIHIVPNKAIGAMKDNSASTPNKYTWSNIFEEALDLANAEQAASANLLSSLNLSGAISANTGDATFASVSNFVKAPVKTPAGDANVVNGGNWWEYHMLADSKIGPEIPAPLRLSYDDYLLDKKYPLISLTKDHVYWYQKGLYVSPDNYPLYNLIQYPDVKFGYKRPGELFVAKRNWWVFSLTFGSHNESITGLPPVTKNYVLSIYEIPSQLPLSAASIMQVGQFADGTDWQNVTLEGGIHAEVLNTSGTVSLTGGSISAGKTLNLSGTTTVEGRSVQGGFDEMGERESRALSSTSDFYDASVGGNVGKVAFIPINPGHDFLKRSMAGARSSRITPTGWKDYSRGANQVKMRIDVLEMVALDTQIPKKIRFYYTDTSKAWRSVDYERGVNWPTELEAGGNTFPFQSGELENLRNALILHLDRLPAFLATNVTEAAGIDVNNSIYVSPVNSSPTVQAPSMPSLDSDMSLSVRGGKDMTPYTKGFSVVTDVRLYITETLNSVAMAPPPNSGLAGDAEYYPPVSLFAPEKRFGESLDFQSPIDLRGQLSTLKNSTGDTFNPLELKGANDSRVATDKLHAELVTLRSPAELPPIHMINWMVTIEEVQ